MLTILSSTCLIFAACGLLYQADKRRSALAAVRNSNGLRLAMRAAALFILLITLNMLASLQGWELGVPVWLGIFSFAFVAGLFLSAQKPNWHANATAAMGGLGIVFGIGALIL